MNVPAPRGPASIAEPEAVRSFAGILADWLASYTMPAPLGAEMADALEAGSDWVGAIAAAAVRRGGWSDTESAAWGICVAALAGAQEAAARSLDGETGRRDPGATADGSARSLLAADGLIAAAHEALSALGEDRLLAVMDALEREFGDGGSWRGLARSAKAGGRPAWPRLVPLALAPAAAGRPDGPWAALAGAWRDRHGPVDRPEDDRDGQASGTGSDPSPETALYEHPAADAATNALLESAAAAARRPRGSGAVGDA